MECAVVESSQLKSTMPGGKTLLSTILWRNLKQSDSWANCLFPPLNKKFKKVIVTFYLTILTFFHRIARYKLAIARHKDKLSILTFFWQLWVCILQFFASYKIQLWGEKKTDMFSIASLFHNSDLTRNCTFILHYSDFISQNCEFISHNYDFITRNWDFISRDARCKLTHSQLPF